MIVKSLTVVEKVVKNTSGNRCAIAWHFEESNDLSNGVHTPKNKKEKHS